jgi:hypothetical protein
VLIDAFEKLQNSVDYRFFSVLHVGMRPVETGI